MEFIISNNNFRECRRYENVSNLNKNMSYYYFIKDLQMVINVISKIEIVGINSINSMHIATEKNEYYTKLLVLTIQEMQRYDIDLLCKNDMNDITKKMQYDCI